MNADYIAGLEEAYRLLNLDEELDYGPGRIVDKIKQMKTTPENTTEQLEKSKAVEGLRGWCTTSDRGAPIDDICETIADYDELWLHLLQSKAALAQREDQLRRAEAQAAGIREALADANHYFSNCERLSLHDSIDARRKAQRKVEKALCTDCGKSILARLEEARCLINDVTATAQGEAWFKRRDDFNKGHTPTGPLPSDRALRDWVNCPICGEPDMRKEPDGDGYIINCVNLACASNGGGNSSALKTADRALLARLEEARRLLEENSDACVDNTTVWTADVRKWLSGHTPTGPITDLSNPDSKESHIGTGMAGAVPDSEGEPFGPIPSDRAAELEKEHDKEIGDFQNEVRNLVIKLSGAPDSAIDGKGSDAGWQEFTLSEISQGFAFLADKTEFHLALLETARDLLSRCPGIRTDETQPYWDEVEAFLGREA